MVTRLRPGKKVSRQVDDLVITITQDGAVARFAGKRKTATVSSSEFRAMLLQQRASTPRRTRALAFAQPRPAGWVPEMGEEVYLRCGAPVKGHVRFRADAIPEPLLRVLRNGRVRQEWHALGDLRPLILDDRGETRSTD